MKQFFKFTLFFLFYLTVNTVQSQTKVTVLVENLTDSIVSTSASELTLLYNVDVDNISRNEDSIAKHSFFIAETADTIFDGRHIDPRKFTVAVGSNTKITWQGVSTKDGGKVYLTSFLHEEYKQFFGKRKIRNPWFRRSDKLKRTLPDNLKENDQEKYSLKFIIYSSTGDRRPPRLFGRKFKVDPKLRVRVVQ